MRILNNSESKNPRQQTGIKFILLANWSFLCDGSLERLERFAFIRLRGWTGNGNMEGGNLSAGRNKKLLKCIIYFSNKFLSSGFYLRIKI